MVRYWEIKRQKVMLTDLVIPRVIPRHLEIQMGSKRQKVRQMAKQTQTG
jgi:hypothetical protein